MNLPLLDGAKRGEWSRCSFPALRLGGKEIWEVGMAVRYAVRVDHNHDVEKGKEGREDSRTDL